jgi:hypothetical protein
MYPTHEQVKERQQAMLDLAAQERRARRVRILSRAMRRAERAERQLVSSWHEAARLREELAELELEPRL